jgi:hypothetical protein
MLLRGSHRSCGQRINVAQQTTCIHACRPLFWHSKPCKRCRVHTCSKNERTPWGKNIKSHAQQGALQHPSLPAAELIHCWQTRATSHADPHYCHVKFVISSFQTRPVPVKLPADVSSPTNRLRAVEPVVESVCLLRPTALIFAKPAPISVRVGGVAAPENVNRYALLMSAM